MMPMPWYSPLEATLAAAYALFLVLVVLGLEELARVAARRARQYQTTGFVYHRHLDAWRCPADQWLRLHATDEARRVSRYRAPAAACRVCHLREQCGPAETGREVERPWGAWLESELGRFQRGISLVILGLAAVVLMIEMMRYRSDGARLLMAGALALVVGVGCRLAPGLWGARIPFGGLARVNRG